MERQTTFNDRKKRWPNLFTAPTQKVNRGIMSMLSRSCIVSKAIFPGMLFLPSQWYFFPHKKALAVYEDIQTKGKNLLIVPPIRVKATGSSVLYQIRFLWDRRLTERAYGEVAKIPPP